MQLKNELFTEQKYSKTDRSLQMLLSLVIRNSYPSRFLLSSGVNSSNSLASSFPRNAS